MKTALVYGAGGFIGSHLVKRLKKQGYWVRGVDLKYPEFGETHADDFIIGDLTSPDVVAKSMINPYMASTKDFDNSFTELYQLAADMGGAGYIFTGENDANVMHNSALINLNTVYHAKRYLVKKVFFSSSACMYPEHNQLDPNNPNCEESSAYPANPDSEYGWEKLFSERLYEAWQRNYGLNIRIARFHNIYGPESTWTGGREKAPAALCRKIAEAKNKDSVEIWGDGKQTRSFLYIEECLDAMQMLMESDYQQPVNIGSEEMVSINELVDIISKVSKKNVIKKHIKGPLGVRGRNSDNTLFLKEVGNPYRNDLEHGIRETYKWVKKQIDSKAV